MATNVEFLNLVRDLNDDIANRIDPVTKANFADAMTTILDDSKLRNSFYETMLNKIVETKIIDKEYIHNLKMFKGETIPYGDGIETVIKNLVEGKTYEEGREYNDHPFKREIAEVMSFISRRNRAVKYKETISERELSRAFTSSTGLSSLSARAVQNLTNSDEFDEFLTMLKMIKEGDAKGWINKIVVPTIDTLDGVQDFVIKLKETSNNWLTPSTDYNTFGLYTWTSKEDQVIMIDSYTDATVDVKLLAQAFNVSYDEFEMMKVVVPQLPVENAFAILMDKNVLKSYDTSVQMTNIFNPDNLDQHFWRHHSSINSYNPYLNCVAFVSVEPTVTGITVNGNTTANKGIVEQYSVTVDGTDFPTANVTWEVIGGADEYTTITQGGVLYVGKNETSTSLTVKATHVDDTGDGLLSDEVTVSVI